MVVSKFNILILAIMSVPITNPSFAQVHMNPPQALDEDAVERKNLTDQLAYLKSHPKETTSAAGLSIGDTFPVQENLDENSGAIGEWVIPAKYILDANGNLPLNPKKASNIPSNQAWTSQTLTAYDVNNKVINKVKVGSKTISEMTILGLMPSGNALVRYHLCAVHEEDGKNTGNDCPPDIQMVLPVAELNAMKGPKAPSSWTKLFSSLSSAHAPWGTPVTDSTAPVLRAELDVPTLPGAQSSTVNTGSKALSY